MLVNGLEERHPEGNYYLSWYEGKRLKRLSVGKDAATATARQLAKQAELNARNVSPVNGISLRIPLVTLPFQITQTTAYTLLADHQLRFAL